MKFSITIVLFSAFFSSGVCQKVEAVRFNEILHDFGSVKEEEGAIEHEFQFTNVSPDSVKITRVQASCGCTTPNWSRETVPPGGTGFIQAKYNPLNRPGAFNKYLTVSIDKQAIPIRLIIKGNVIPKIKSIEEELPTQLGSIRVQYKSFNMGNIYTVDVPTTKVYDVYNAGNVAVTFLDSLSAPSYIKMAVNPKTLKPLEKGEIAISYDAKSRNDLGFVNDNVTLFTDEKGDDALKAFSVYANIMEYFPPLTEEEKSKVPKPVLSLQSHDFGRLKSGQKPILSVTLSNEGKEVLMIRKIQPNCSCIIVDTEREEVLPGKSVVLRMTYDTSQSRGNQRKAVTLYTNSPITPISRITISAYVEQE